MVRSGLKLVDGVGGGAERARCGAAVCGEVGRGEVIAEIGRGWVWCGG